MAVLRGKAYWPVDNQEIRRKKGPLVRVELQPGRFVKMYQADAIAQGYLKAPATQEKEKPVDRDKMRKAEWDKAEQPKKQEPPADDFTQIPGVGKATARALEANGITTFEQLSDAKSLDFLPEKAQEAIAEWLSKQPGPDDTWSFDGSN